MAAWQEEPRVQSPTRDSEIPEEVGEKLLEVQSGGSDCENPIPNEGGDRKSSCILGAKRESTDQEVGMDDAARTQAFSLISTADFQFDHETASDIINDCVPDFLAR